MIAITDDLVVSEDFINKIDTVKKDYHFDSYSVFLKNKDKEFEFMGLSKEHAESLITIIKERN